MLPLPILGPLCLFSLHPPSYSFVVGRKIIMRLRCLGSLLLWRNVCHGSKALKLRAFPSVKILALRSKKTLIAFEIHSHIPAFGRTRLSAQRCSYVVFHALTYSTYGVRGFDWKAFMTGVSEQRRFQAYWAAFTLPWCVLSVIQCFLLFSVCSVISVQRGYFCFPWAIPKLTVILLNMNKSLGLWLLTSSFLLGLCLLPFLLYWLDVSCLFSLISPHHVCT